MSASLVGSEMCIRDSPFPPRIGSDARPLAACRPGVDAHFSPVELTAPVSYTHLTLPTICSV
eukprot:14583014-Alexandrium_andersonii.AAC.1